MKKTVISIAIFISLLSCSNNKQESKENIDTPAKTEKVSVIDLQEDLANYTFTDWNNTTIQIPTEKGLKLIGIYDEKNDIVSIEQISFSEIKKILDDRVLNDYDMVIFKIENKKGDIIDYNFTMKK